MKKAESGKLQKEIGQRAKEKKPYDDLKQRRIEIEEEVKAAEPELERLEHELNHKFNRLGNIVHASVKGRYPSTPILFFPLYSVCLSLLSYVLLSNITHNSKQE